MNRLAAALLAIPMAVAVAQDTRDAATPFQWAPPDESTPFFISDTDFTANEDRILRATDPASQYPLVKKGPQTVSGQVMGFFTDMFASVNLSSPMAAREEAELTLKPEAPTLADTREVGVDYSIRNNSRRMARLDFPTSQRIEILTRNSSGAVIDRWSDDRSFQPQEGIVIINPNERIEYREKISTRDMKPGQTYEVEAMLKTDPDFRLQKQLAPR
ncbi:MAG: BsuPI-related putative proteinase inhibitor [Terrimicrobiaceae bacterium]